MGSQLVGACHWFARLGELGALHAIPHGIKVEADLALAMLATVSRTPAHGIIAGGITARMPLAECKTLEQNEMDTCPGSNIDFMQLLNYIILPENVLYFRWINVESDIGSITSRHKQACSSSGLDFFLRQSREKLGLHYDGNINLTVT